MASRKSGAAIATIGLPCIIEAVVPIASLGHQCFLPRKVARRYLISHGYQTAEPVDHGGAITCPLLAQNIREVIRFPSPKFSALTGCDEWSPPI